MKKQPSNKSISRNKDHNNYLIAPFNAAAAHEQVTKLVADIKQQRYEFLEVAAFSADNIQENRTELKGKSRFIEMWGREVEGLL